MMQMVLDPRASGCFLAAVVVAAGLSACTPGPIDVIDLDPTMLHSGLIAHWSFDEGGGDTLYDDAGSDTPHPGTLEGAYTWIGGRFGGAVRFTAGGVSVPAFPPPSSGVGSWSVTAWVRTPPELDTGSTWATVISNELLRTGGWQLNIRYPTPPAAYQFAYWRGPEENRYIFQDHPPVVVDRWVHVVGVYDAIHHLAWTYVDGAPVFESGVAVSTPADQSIKQGTTTLWMARWPPDSTLLANNSNEQRRLIGDLDEIAIYNRALEPKEIAALARAPVPHL
jgi:hypothetical protein